VRLNDNTEKSFKKEDERSWNEFVWHGKVKEVKFSVDKSTKDSHFSPADIF
jgi:hypothetical protein